MMSMLQRSTMSHQHKKHRPLSRSSWMPSLSPKISGTFGFQDILPVQSSSSSRFSWRLQLAFFPYLQELPTPLCVLETMFPFSKFLDMWHLGSSATIETSYGQDNAVPVGGSPLCRPLFSVSHSLSYDSSYVIIQLRFFKGHVSFGECHRNQQSQLPNCQSLMLVLSCISHVH